MWRSEEWEAFLAAAWRKRSELDGRIAQKTFSRSEFASGFWHTCKGCWGRWSARTGGRAEYAGDATPDGVQRLLAQWDA